MSPRRTRDEKRSQPLRVSLRAAGRGQCRTDQKSARDSLGPCVTFEDREHAAHGVADEVHRLGRHGVDESRERGAHHVDARPPRAERRETKPWQIERDNARTTLQERPEREPVEVRAAETMNQHHDRSLAAEIGVVNGLSTQVDRLRDHTRGVVCVS
jgi:hypothetical protein